MKQRNGRLHEIVGPRHKVQLNTRALRRLVPDIAQRDIYVCGPEPLSALVVAAADQLGAGPEQIHQETFGF